MFTQKDIDFFNSIETPFYFYNTDLLQKTIDEVRKSASPAYHIHYALKANAHPAILERIKASGFGADCVSGNEVKRAIECGLMRKALFLLE